MDYKVLFKAEASTCFYTEADSYVLYYCSVYCF